MAGSLSKTYSWVRVWTFRSDGIRSAVVSRRKSTVIVVDNDLSVCRGLRMHLEILGYKVLVLHRAERLLTSAIPTGDDVCLLADVYQPGMSGIELCRRPSEAYSDWRCSRGYRRGQIATIIVVEPHCHSVRSRDAGPGPSRRIRCRHTGAGF